jgi:hypothetical protein
MAADSNVRLPAIPLKSKSLDILTYHKYVLTYENHCTTKRAPLGAGTAGG